MYDEIWTGAKGFYKVEPVVADGGEVILYAPHIREIATSHPQIHEIGYHCRDYFVKQWDAFKDVHWGVLAHSTHLRGAGTYDPATGEERLRVDVTLATGIPEEVCRAVNLGYRDPATIDVAAFAADPDTLVVRGPARCSSACAERSTAAPRAAPGSTSGVPLGWAPCATAMQLRTPVKPIRYSGDAMVVSAGSTSSSKMMLSNPTTLTCAGTAKPSLRRPFITPMASCVVVRQHRRASTWATRSAALSPASTVGSFGPIRRTSSSNSAAASRSARQRTPSDQLALRPGHVEDPLVTERAQVFGGPPDPPLGRRSPRSWPRG